MTILSQAYVEWEQKTKEEGIQIGEQRGIQIGARAANQKAVLGFHQLGLSVEQIAQGLELDPEVVQEILDSSSAAQA